MALNKHFSTHVKKSGEKKERRRTIILLPPATFSSPPTPFYSTLPVCWMTAKVAKILSYMCARLVPPFYLRKIVCCRFVYKPKRGIDCWLYRQRKVSFVILKRGGGLLPSQHAAFFLLVWEKRLLAVNRARLSPLPPCHSSSYYKEEKEDNFLCKLPPASDPPSSPRSERPAIISFFSRRRRKMREIAVNWGWAKEEGDGH